MDKDRDILYSRRSQEIKSAITEAERIVAGESYVEEEYQIPIPMEYVGIFSGYVRGEVELSERVLRDGNVNPVVQRYLHPENPLISLQCKFDTLRLPGVLISDEFVSISTTGKEVSLLGQIIYESQMDEREERDVFSVRLGQLNDDAWAYIQFVNTFEEMGGDPDLRFFDMFTDILEGKLEK